MYLKFLKTFYKASLDTHEHVKFNARQTHYQTSFLKDCI